MHVVLPVCPFTVLLTHCDSSDCSILNCSVNGIHKHRRFFRTWGIAVLCCLFKNQLLAQFEEVVGDFFSSRPLKIFRLFVDILHKVHSQTVIRSQLGFTNVQTPFKVRVYKSHLFKKLTAQNQSGSQLGFIAV